MQVFDLFGTISLKDSGVSDALGKIDDKAKGTGDKMGSIFSGIGGMALKLGAILGAGLGFKAMMDNASATEDALALMGAHLKSSGDACGMNQKQLVALAVAQGNVTEYSKNTNLATEDLLLTFTNLHSNVFPSALTAVNNMAAALGEPPATAARTLGKALNDPVKGITLLARAGVVFTAGQKAQITAMEKAGDVAGAQKIILDQLAKSYGGSASAAAKTFGGSLVILQNHIADLGGSIVAKLQPVLAGVFVWVNQHMPQITSFVNGAVSSMTKDLTGIATYLEAHLIPTFDGFRSWITVNIPIIKNFLSGMVDIVVPRFKMIIDVCGQIYQEIFPKTLGSSKDLSTAIKSLTTEGLDIFIVALTWVKNNMPLVKGVLAAFGAVLLIHKGYVMACNIQTAIANGLAEVNAIKTGVCYVAGGIWNGVVGAGVIAQKAWGVITSENSILMTAFSAIMDANPIAIVIIAIGALIIIGVLLWKNWAVVKEKCGELWTGIESAFSQILNLGKEALGWGAGLIAGIVAGIKAGATDLVNGIKQICDLVITKFKAFFGIHSPSTVFHELGGHLIQGLINGMGAKDLVGFAGNMMSDLKGAFGGMFGGLGGTTKGSVADWLMQAIQATGISSTNLPDLEAIVQHESSGNPNAINLTDSNAQAGHPSQGLMQCIPSTFEKYRSTSLPNDIDNPVANAVAAIKYILATYGSVANVPGVKSLLSGSAYRGYATGTNNATSGLHWVGENGPELVNFKGGETVKNAKDSAEMSGNVTVNLNGTVYMRDPAEVKQTFQQLRFSASM